MLQIPYEQLPLSDDFSIVPSDYYKANGGVVFPNPNAPTGKLMPLDEIEDIIKHNQDVIVVVDEAYVDFGGESALPLLTNMIMSLWYRHSQNHARWQAQELVLPWQVLCLSSI